MSADKKLRVIRLYASSSGWPIFKIASSPQRVPIMLVSPAKSTAGPPVDSQGFLVSCALLLGTRLRRHKACEAVVHNELAVVFTAMFDDAVCYVENARFLSRGNKQPRSSSPFRLSTGWQRRRRQRIS